MNSALPDNILRCMSSEDRKALGQKTAKEVMEHGEAKSEKDLQKQIVQLLRLKGIEPIVSRMDKRTSNNVGTPDILFAIRGTLTDDPFGGTRDWNFACAWEVKLPGRPLRPDQEVMRLSMTKAPNTWRWRLVTSVDGALKELSEMGVA